MDTAKKGVTDVQHCFEIRTANVDYLVGQIGNMSVKSTSSSGLGADLAKEWETAIRKAHSPVTVAAGSGATLAPPPHHASHRLGHFLYLSFFDASSLQFRVGRDFSKCWGLGLTYFTRS